MRHTDARRQHVLEFLNLRTHDELRVLDDSAHSRIDLWAIRQVLVLKVDKRHCLRNQWFGEEHFAAVAFSIPSEAAVSAR